ncbi:DNA methyltransferase [Scytonema sp. NUACC26]|uniref:DNA methyltransferase n=1 Tax=Scytonema sp. NUACC26 TaxID=3140176 RepID=UPI0034DC7BF7
MSQIIKANQTLNNKFHILKAPSTVGRPKSISLNTEPTFTLWQDSYLSLHFGDSLDYYTTWETPTVIVSDGGYGILGFEGDTSDHFNLPQWYEPHIEQWTKYSVPQTTLWFWNSEIGWASVHPILEKYGWHYVNCNIWNKGKGHIAGNVNTQKIRRFPVVTEVCVQYVLKARINEIPLKEWLLSEWKRTGLPLKKANEACGVKDVATRKYFDQGHLWYFPPPEMFEKMSNYANQYGNPDGRPYFSRDKKTPMTKEEWKAMRSKFYCPHGITNVWERNALRGKERITINSSKAVHLNQKPLDLTLQIIEASSDVDDVVWEPFGGLFTASIAARKLRRKAFAAEIDWTYFYYGVQRAKAEYHLPAFLE